MPTHPEWSWEREERVKRLVSHLTINEPDENDPHMNMGAGTDTTLLAKAMGAVMAYVETHLEKTDPKPYYNVYMVWFSKTLQNWKALLSTTLPDGMYYEVTYNGDKKEMYVDAYKKFENVVIPDEEEGNDAPISSDPSIHRS